MSERIDTEIKKAVCEAAGAPRSEVRERAVAAMAAARPARRWSRRGAAAVAGVTALIGLGFVPFPAGSAEGAFSKALAMTNEATAVHVAGRIWGPVGEWRFEQWWTRDGFKRFDLYDGDQVVQRWLYDPGARMIYPRAQETEPVLRLRKMTVDDPGDVWQAAPLIGPGAEVHRKRDVLPRDDVLPRIEPVGESENPVETSFWQRLADQEKTLAVRVEERERCSLWGGRRTVADVYAHRREGAHIEVLILGNLIGPVYEWLGPGDDVWVHMEADAESGAILALEQRKRVDGRWVLIYRVDSIESGVEIGDDVRDPALPEHHVQIEDTWWRERLVQTLARGESGDWLVTLHSLDVNRHGDLFVTLSRSPQVDIPPVREQAGGPVPRVESIFIEATDDLGTRYLLPRYRFRFLRALPECDARVRLVPESPRASRRVPRTITVQVTIPPVKGIYELTGIRSIPSDEWLAFDAWFRETYYQRITFADLPVPDSQPGDSLIAEAIRRTER